MPRLAKRWSGELPATVVVVAPVPTSSFIPAPPPQLQERPRGGVEQPAAAGFVAPVPEVACGHSCGLGAQQDSGGWLFSQGVEGEWCGPGGRT
eukprot:322826-Chlamydomonas_euryale.AAC.1